MTSFGKFLGKENGKLMLAEIATDDATREQMRAAVTTYCIIFGIEVDTADWDSLIDWLYQNFNCWFDTKNEMDNFMCTDLV